MSLAQKLMGHPHHAGDGSGGHIVRPRVYECTTAVCFLGRRRSAYDRIVALAAIGPGDRVLDVGCGTGFLTRRAARAAGPTGRVVGVDPSEPVVAYARRQSPPWCEYHVTGGEHIDEPDGSFDVVVSSLAMHHIPGDQRPVAMQQMHRLLRPGGRLVIAEFRPPRSRIGGHLVGAVAGNAMRHAMVEHLPAAIAGAGFTVTGTGNLWPFLSYVTADRP